LPSDSIHDYSTLISELKSVYPTIEIQTDLPKLSDILGDRLPKLVIMDDLMDIVLNHPLFETMFTRKSHHNNCSLIFTSQNYFGGKPGRSTTIIRQTSHKVVFNDIGNKTLLRNISCQITPTNPQFLNECFNSLEKYFPEDRYAYVVIDCQKKSGLYKLPYRSNVFPNSQDKIEPICFLPQGN
ncbi:MAG: hypothetical protein Q8O46_02505, partial [bacterium]|nr:hypothetical protein [bacterium]